MIGSSRRPAALLTPVVFFATLLMHRPSNSSEVPDPSARVSDVESSCGASSLAVLLRLEGNVINLDEIGSRLADRPTHSIAQLRDAAGELGLPLRGVRITARAWPLDRPALCYFKRGKDGHFAVIRPVGHSGRLVQIIDSIQGIEVQDATRLFASREWTGAALVPVRLKDGIWMQATLRVSLFGACAVFFFVIYKIAPRMIKSMQRFFTNTLSRRK